MGNGFTPHTSSLGGVYPIASWYISQWSFFPPIPSVNYVLSVYVLYERNRRMLWILSSILAIEAIVSTAIEIYSISGVVYNLTLGCIVASTRQVYLTIWYESDLSFMLLWLSAQYLQDFTPSFSNCTFWTHDVSLLLHLERISYIRSPFRAC